MLKRGDILIFRKIAGNRIFASYLLHKKRKSVFKKILTSLKNLMRDLHLTEKIELEFVYQYDLAKIAFITCVERDDCILPKWRLSTDAIPFKRLKFQIVNKKISQKIS